MEITFFFSNENEKQHKEKKCSTETTQGVKGAEKQYDQLFTETFRKTTGEKELKLIKHKKK
jgi:hypothetical protein